MNASDKRVTVVIKLHIHIFSDFFDFLSFMDSQIYWQSDMMHGVHSETPSGSRVRSHSDRSIRSGKSQGSSRSGSQRSARSVTAAHVVHPEPSTPTKMESENVSTKRSEPEAPKVDPTLTRRGKQEDRKATEERG